ncbi:MAG: SBBP repeat-containing protein [candidate division Zixibacteria bacterium]|nr:SBBP repeat-containing protein [candidate division Zixibacteria bacterium]
MTRKLWWLSVIFIFRLPVGAQDLDTAWVRFYNGFENREDVATALAVDGDGNVYVTGSTEDSNNKENYLTIKYSREGNIEWASEYDGPEYGVDFPVAIAVSDSGFVYVTGSSYSGPDNYDIVTIKYHSDGDTAWVRRYAYPGNSNDWARALVVDKDGFVYLTGSIKSGKILLTIKYEPDGDTAWTRTYYNSPLGNNIGYDIATDNDGHIFVTGCRANSYTDIDIVTLKYTTSGCLLWTKAYNGPGNYYDWAEAIAVDDDGYVYVTGASEGDETNMDYVTIKYAPDGDSEWVRRYSGGGEDSPDKSCALALDDEGNVFITGYSRGNMTGFDYLTIKYNAVGDTAWTRRYNGPDNLTDWPCDIDVDRYGNVVVAGESYSQLSDADFMLIMYDTEGTLRWLEKFNGPGNGEDDLAALALDNDGNIYVTGLSDGVGSDCDFATIKYSPVLTDVDELISDILPEEYTLNQNYPNPFNPATNIEYTVASRSYINLAVYNILGQEIKILVDGIRSIGTYRAVWDGTDQNGRLVATGIYFYRLQTGTTVKSKKMLLLR